MKKVIDSSFYAIPKLPPHRDLPKIVNKNILNFPKFYQCQPANGDSLISFEYAKSFVDKFYEKRQNSDGKRIIFDSGCGKATSSVRLAKMFPDIPVIGIDRSHRRLSENKFYTVLDGQKKRTSGYRDDDEDDDYLEEELVNDDLTSQDGNPISFPNLLILNGELNSFWKLICSQSDWKIARHYLLYPNPSPKLSDVKLRFPGKF